MSSDSPHHLFDQIMAPVSREQAARLVGYDHHRVWVGEKLGVMLTYHWMPLEEATEPLVLIVIVPPPVIAQAHPPAPPEVQAVVDQLTWTRADA